MNDHDDSIRSHARYADSYDAQVREYGCYGAEILFGLCFAYVIPGSRLLDIGIGTGLSSEPFAKAGMEICGVDGSDEMLRVCRKKCIAKELMRHDLNRLPLPYAASSFSIVVACGVFHFFGDLAPLFTDIFRMLEPGGVFSFTIMREYCGRKTDPGKTGAGCRSEMSQEGVEVFTHTERYIRELLHRCRFEELKEQFFITRDQSLYSAHVVRKTA